MRLNKRLYNNNTFTLRPYILGAVVVGGALIQFRFVFVAAVWWQRRGREREGKRGVNIFYGFYTSVKKK